MPDTSQPCAVWVMVTRVSIGHPDRRPAVATDLLVEEQQRLDPLGRRRHDSGHHDLGGGLLTGVDERRAQIGRGVAVGLGVLRRHQRGRLGDLLVVVAVARGHDLGQILGGGVHGRAGGQVAEHDGTLVRGGRRGVPEVPDLGAGQQHQRGGQAHQGRRQTGRVTVSPGNGCRRSASGRPGGPAPVGAAGCGGTASSWVRRSARVPAVATITLARACWSATTALHSTEPSVTVRSRRSARTNWSAEVV